MFAASMILPISCRPGPYPLRLILCLIRAHLALTAVPTTGRFPVSASNSISWGSKPGRTGITLHETGFEPANAGWNYPGVFSPFWRLYYNTDRGHGVLIGEQMTELTTDVIVIIPPHCLFHCLGQNPVAHFWMAFSFTRRLQPGTSLPVRVPPRDTELCLIRDVKTLLAAQPDHQPSDAVYRNSLALLQVVLARPELQWHGPLPENLVRVRQHIDTRYASKLHSPVLARLSGLSLAGFNRAYFSRVFKRVIGESPAGFRRKQRPAEERVNLGKQGVADPLANT